MTDLLPEPADGRRVVVYRATPFARRCAVAGDHTVHRDGSGNEWVGPA